MLELKNITAWKTKDETILENIDVKFPKNSLTLVLGPNAAGKTTLAESISGVSELKITGSVFFQNKDITKKRLEERAKLGILHLYQNPVEIPGLKIFDFLFASYKAIVTQDTCVWDFHELLLEKLQELKLEKNFLERNLNEGFSGGEKKKFEILQMLILKPKVVILDEIDSGLDIDTVKKIFKIIEKYKQEEKAIIILISHAPEILKGITPNQVLLIQDKMIKKQGDIKLAKQILKKGYE